MFPFRRKKNDDEDMPNQDSLNEDLTAPTAAKQTAAIKPGQESFAADVAKLKAEVEAFSDVRKATNEKFTRLSEQIGELRAMIADRDRMMNQLELKATKAADLVEAVHPEQQMVEIRKEDAKVEALKANIEGNELLMKKVLDELKTMRTQIASFRGVEEIVKMNNEVKSEIVEIKKVEVNIEKHSDKVETIFAEVQKRFIDIGKIDDSIAANSKQITDLSKNLDYARVKAESAAPKKSVDELQAKFNELKGQLNDVITVLNRRFTELENNNKRAFEAFENILERKFNLSKQSLNDAVSALQSINPDDIVKKPADNPQTASPANNAQPQQNPQPQSASQPALPVQKAEKAKPGAAKAAAKRSAPGKPSPKKAKSPEEEIREAAKYVEQLKKRKKK
ncbi:hypothetical protein COT07_03230 [Candidatus Woesearchaeota archaeon CG07_land_8_20_14_0_80_44_23]|nr:MAG: hypothetical protein COT07_03230 [Candidatus Woesearchaeota archaeon CG07_land_8_20_14_0_80_44_23]